MELFTTLFSIRMKKDINELSAKRCGGMPETDTPVLRLLPPDERNVSAFPFRRIVFFRVGGKAELSLSFEI
jgi:hypothetical protein